MNQQAELKLIAAKLAMEKQETSFPAMLFRMLTDIDEMARREPYMKSLQSVVSWQEHGKAFRVHDKKRFIDVVMPTWFSRIKYSSWVRQLSSYGFQKVHTNGADKGGQSILNGSHLLLLPSTFIIQFYLSHFPPCL